LLRGLLLWRAGIQWYALALFGFLVLCFVPQALNPSCPPRVDRVASDGGSPPIRPSPWRA
jgi:hypothetical protein